MSLDGPGLPRRRWPAASAGLIAAGGVLGLSGVAVSAAASHAGGGSLGQTAGLFLLLHAAVIVALAGFVALAARPAVLAAAGACLIVGVGVFAGDLVLAGFWDWRPFPPAAPIGGGLLLIGWLAVTVGGALFRSRV